MFAMVAEGDSAARLDLTPDVRTLAFTAAVALVTALLFGLAPALRATRVDLTIALKSRAQPFRQFAYSHAQMITWGRQKCLTPG